MNKTILIIDDDDMLRRALVRGLRGDGFDTLAADSAESATEILGRVRVDAIVLDRMMSGRDGLAFLQDIRAHGDDTPVLMLTAMTGAENAIAGLSGGADDYLGKPFQLRELVLRLNNIMKKRGGAESHLPDGMFFADGEFFVRDTNASDAPPRALMLSGEEKKLLRQLTTPVGNISPAAPMVAKRLRMKLNGVSSKIDIITVRGRGYKLVYPDAATQQNGTKQ